jgi:hypothetical protein
VLLADVVVQGVEQSDRGSFGAHGGQDVTLSVAAPLAARVVDALSLDGATIRAGLLTGPAEPPAGPLPDLVLCSSPAGP